MRLRATPSRSPPSRSASGSSPAAFPAGRPALGGRRRARSSTTSTPFEQRKLWLLNGSHSLLAYAGSIRGHATIDEAIADPAVPGLGRGVLGRGAAATSSCPATPSRDYRSALLAPVRQPADPPPAGPDRGRRIHQARRPDPADDPGRAGRRTHCRSAAPRRSPPGSAPARSGGHGQGRRRGRRAGGGDRG